MNLLHIDVCKKCSICDELGADMECNPVVHPLWANAWVHEDCLHEWEHEANKELCEELQRYTKEGEDGADTDIKHD